MKKLLFGSAGVPHSSPSSSTLDGVKTIKKLGLDCMELEFVRGVKMSPETAKQVNLVRKETQTALSAHGPYWINLNSFDKQKIGASRMRILQTAKIASLCGATTITFHAAFYQKMDKQQVYNNVKVQLQKILDELKKQKNKVWIRPELTGKETQFGDLQELIKLSQELDQVLPCVDFSHYHARYAGKYNSYKEFRSMLEELENGLGRRVLDNMHVHVSGIEYTDKGERRHVNLKESDMDYAGLVKAWKEFNIKGIVISESPNLEEDALLLKEAYDNF
jgi:deoxyribonuclease-4